MKTGDKVKVKSTHRFHSNKEGIILLFGEEETAGLVVLTDPNDANKHFAVKINDLIKS